MIHSLILWALRFSLSLAGASEVYYSINAQQPFTSLVYQRLASSEGDSFVFSPWSAMFALVSIKYGAKDFTSSEITDTFLRDTTQEDEIQYPKSILDTKRPFVLDFLSRIYMNEKVRFNHVFQALTSEASGLNFERVDFSTNLTATRINKWVQEQTGRKLIDLIDHESLNNDTVAIVSSILHFHGKWEQSSFEFKQARRYKFEKAKDFELWEIPFLGNGATFNVVSSSRKEISEIEKQVDLVLTKDDARFLGYSLVSFPEFRLQETVDFKRVLQELGVRTVFTDDADLSIIAGKKGELKVDRVFQKTFVSIDGRGVEAAVSTVADVRSVRGNESGTSETPGAGSPFIFYVAFKDMLLLVGRIADPVWKI